MNWSELENKSIDELRAINREACRIIRQKVLLESAKAMGEFRVGDEVEYDVGKRRLPTRGKIVKVGRTAFVVEEPALFKGGLPKQWRVPAHMLRKAGAK